MIPRPVTQPHKDAGETRFGTDGTAEKQRQDRRRQHTGHMMIIVVFFFLHRGHDFRQQRGAGTPFFLNQTDHETAGHAETQSVQPEPRRAVKKRWDLRPEQVDPQIHHAQKDPENTTDHSAEGCGEKKHNKNLFCFHSFFCFRADRISSFFNCSFSFCISRSALAASISSSVFS